MTPGTPGGLMLMLAEYGTLSLADVLGPSIELADGYPIEAETADNIERWKDKLKEWPYSKQVMLPHLGERARRRAPGEIFRQPDLAATLRKLVEAERRRSQRASRARKRSRPPTTASIAATSPQEFVRGVQEQGGLITLADLDKWRPLVEEPLQHELPWHRGLQARHLDAGPGAAAVAQHPRELRPQGAWVTTAPTTSTRSTRR